MSSLRHYMNDRIDALVQVYSPPYAIAPFGAHFASGISNNRKWTFSEIKKGEWHKN